LNDSAGDSFGQIDLRNEAIRMKPQKKQSCSLKRDNEQIRLHERRIVVNPPPADARCECCGRHVSDLKPFGGPGDPLAGDFRGALLVKTWRTMTLQLTEEQLRELRQKHGDEAAEAHEQLQNTIEASWECRDCIILSGDEYFKVIHAKR